MKKIVTIIGARPQFIKTPLVSEVISKFAREIIIHTGQHYDDEMSGVFFRELKIKKPKYNLNIGSGAQGEQTAKMLSGIEKILIKEKPNLVIIYGDTNSTLAGALAASKLHIPIAHIEAGMRSYNRQMPEEINRIVSDHTADLLFCSTKSSVNILKSEGIIKNIYHVGDVMCDVQENVKSQTCLAGRQVSKVKILESLSIKPKEYILMTIHRQENTDIRENLKNIVHVLSKIDKTIIWPIHPRTKKALEKYKLDSIIAKMPHIRLIKPVGYLDMITLENSASLILTDSGGVQKESYIAKVPCITFRNETEWIETVRSGWNHLTGTNISKILELVNNYPKPKNHLNIFGDGYAYKKIGKIINKYLNNKF